MIGGAPSSTWMPGVIRMPPPTPNSPASRPETRPIAMPIATVAPERHRSSSAARTSTSRSPRYAARLSARSSGNHRISSISSSRSSMSPPGVAHQEEVHGLADADVLPHVEVAGLPEGGLDLGEQAGLLPDLSDRRVLRRLLVLDAALGEPPGELAPAGSAGREHDLDLIVGPADRPRLPPRSPAWWERQTPSGGRFVGFFLFEVLFLLERAGVPVAAASGSSGLLGGHRSRRCVGLLLDLLAR